MVELGWGFVVGLSPPRPIVTLDHFLHPWNFSKNNFQNSYFLSFALRTSKLLARLNSVSGSSRILSSTVIAASTDRFALSSAAISAFLKLTEQVGFHVHVFARSQHNSGKWKLVLDNKDYWSLPDYSLAPSRWQSFCFGVRFTSVWDFQGF